MLFPQFIHCSVDLVDREVPVNLLHCLPGVLHRVERFLVDIGRFDRVDLLLDLGDLRRGLFEGAFVEFLAAEGCFGGYSLLAYA
jgi:hypothetical protein